MAGREALSAAPADTLPQVPAAGTFSSMRPRLREDVVFFPTPTGALLRTDSGTTVLEGCATFELLKALAPHLTGEKTVLELGAGLQPGAADALPALVRLLVEHGLADPGSAANGLAPDAVRTLFSPELDLLHRLVDRPIERFDRFRDADVVVVGQGASFAACCAALTRAGLATLLACPVDEEADVDDARAAAETLTAAGAAASVQIVGSIADVAPSERLLAIYCSDAPIPGDIAALNRACCVRRHELLVGCMLDDVGLCGPLVESLSGGCWLCAVIRILKDLPAAAGRAVYSLQHRTTASAATSHAALAHAVGQEVAFEGFKILTGSRRLQTLNQVVVHTNDTAAPFTVTIAPTTLGACLNFCSRLVA